MLQCISSSGLSGLDHRRGSDFAKMYSAAADASVKVIQPICGFLGSAWWALLEFSKEVSTNRATTSRWPQLR
ncbi:MAG: hypothetical protein ACLTMP_07780 [Eggerthella lenta]